MPNVTAFRRAVLRWYEAHRRDLPWRRTDDPWQILVSELMLQQTQVDRVIPKFEAFIRRWPTPAALASASLGDVLVAWSGLGYNRRARHLHEAAQAVMRDRGGVMPTTVDELQALKGVGPYTARAVASFATNADVALWDTNVRRIFFRVFFGGEFAPDPGAEAFATLLEKALPRGRSRDWHNALMDFGSAVCLNRAPQCAACPLKRTCAAAPRFLRGEKPPRSFVKKQAKFDGSRRQARGAVLKMLAASGDRPISRIALIKAANHEEAPQILETLLKEGLIKEGGKKRHFLLP